MKIEDIEITKEDERGIIYNCGQVGFIMRKKGTISANHTHNESEILYLVKGEAELTVDNETEVIKSPVKVTIGNNVYHKLVALTDIMIVRS